MWSFLPSKLKKDVALNAWAPVFMSVYACARQRRRWRVLGQELMIYYGEQDGPRVSFITVRQLRDRAISQPPLQHDAGRTQMCGRREAHLETDRTCRETHREVSRRSDKGIKD